MIVRIGIAIGTLVPMIMIYLPYFAGLQRGIVYVC
jgi:hypothetical protein